MINFTERLLLVATTQAFLILLFIIVIFREIQHEIVVVFECSRQVIQFVLGLLAQRVIANHAYTSHKKNEIVQFSYFYQLSH